MARSYNSNDWRENIIAFILGSGAMLALVLLALPFFQSQSSTISPTTPQIGIGGGPVLDISVTPDTPAIQDIMSIVYAPMQEDVIGRRVKFSSVPVQQVVSPKVFYVGTSASERVLVVHAGNQSIASGDILNIDGTIKKFPDLDSIINIWFLNDTGRQTVQNERIFIDASRITHAQ